MESKIQENYSKPRFVSLRQFTHEELQAALEGQKPIYMINPSYDNILYRLSPPPVNDRILLTWDCDNYKFSFHPDAYLSWYKLGWAFYDNYFLALADQRLSTLDK